MSGLLVRVVSPPVSCDGAAGANLCVRVKRSCKVGWYMHCTGTSNPREECCLGFPRQLGKSTRLILRSRLSTEYENIAWL